MLLPPGRCYLRRLALHAGVAWIPYIWDSTLVGINTPLQAMPSAINSIFVVVLLLIDVL